MEKTNKYDWIIVGAGLAGAVFAYELNKLGIKVLVIEKRDHIGGNCYTYKENNINIHRYGPHIFHTNEKIVWDYVTNLINFKNYNHQVKVNYKDNLYSFPINLKTLNEIDSRIITPSDAERYLEQFQDTIYDEDNFETFCLRNVGPDIYNIFFKGYTQKQWGIEPKKLPSSIIKRIPIRTNFDHTYFKNALYCGMPTDGYTELFEKLFDGVEIILNVDYLKNKEYWNSITKNVVFTGALDEYFDWDLGELEWRSLRFENNTYQIPDYQGIAVMNYTDVDVDFTRIVEHKHFGNDESPVTFVTREYSADWKKGEVPFYPIGDEKNLKLWKEYANRFDELSKTGTNFYRTGRLANYVYQDMDQIILSCLNQFKKIYESDKF